MRNVFRIFFLRYYDILCRNFLILSGKFLIYVVNFFVEPEAACG
jgi:hypothetical protein